MDINSRLQEYLQQPSFSFQFFKPSPCLTPMLITDIHNSDEHSFDQLVNFTLEKYDDFPPQDQKNEPLEPQIQQHVQSIQQNPQKTSYQAEQNSQLSLQFDNSNAPLLAMIRLLIDNTAEPDQKLSKKAAQIANRSGNLMEVYKILSQKFKKLRKTKEEMTKYCMRKAFKTISDKNRNLGNQKNISNNSISGKILKSNASINSILKKINTQKTMNGSFLKKIFSEEGFLQDYNLFLQNFDQLIEEDNDKKIKYLAKVVNEFLLTNDLKKIQGIKRLPWTKDILLKTEQLGRYLPKYADPDFVLVSRKKC